MNPININSIVEETAFNPRQHVVGRIAIVGQRASGKTTLLLELVRAGAQDVTVINQDDSIVEETARSIPGSQNLSVEVRHYHNDPDTIPPDIGIMYDTVLCTHRWPESCRDEGEPEFTVQVLRTPCGSHGGAFEVPSKILVFYALLKIDRDWRMKVLQLEGSAYWELDSMMLEWATPLSRRVSDEEEI